MQTTRLCAAALEQQVAAGSRWLDLGTGTGLLAIVAVRCGASRVLAVDNDPQAVSVATSVVAANGAGDRVEVREGSIADRGGETFDGIVANIQSSFFLASAPEIAAAMADRGVLLASGLLVEDLPEVEARARGRRDLRSPSRSRTGRGRSLCARRRAVMSERTRRAFLPATPAPGDRVDLDVEESHHVARVLRLKRGDALNVFDGAGREWSATIDDVTKDRDHDRRRRRDRRPRRVARSRRRLSGQRPSREARVGAPERDGDRRLRIPDLLVGARRSAAAFAGASHALPADSPRSVQAERPPRACPRSPWASSKRRARESWRSFSPRDRRRSAASLAGSAPREVWIAVGPEGGLTDAEVSALTERGWRAGSLGPRILRTETAGTIAAALILHAWGDLGVELTPPDPKPMFRVGL